MVCQPSLSFCSMGPPAALISLTGAWLSPYIGPAGGWPHIVRLAKCSLKGVSAGEVLQSCQGCGH